VAHDAGCGYSARGGGAGGGLCLGLVVGVVRGFLRRVDWRRGRVKWWVGVGERAWSSRVAVVFRVVRMGDGLNVHKGCNQLK